MIKHIYIPSKGKPESVLIIDWLRKFKFKNFTLVISPEDNLATYKEKYQCEIIQAPKQCVNLPKKLEWLLSTIQRGDWLFTMDDNVIEVTGLVGKGKLTRESSNKMVSPQELLKVVNEDIKRCDAVGAVLGGFASNDNFFFRQNKYRTIGFVWGKMCYYKNVGIQWLPIHHMDDYAMTAMSLLYSGRVLINNNLFAVSKRYQKIGGDGSYEQRVPGKQIAAKFLVEQLKGLYRYAVRPGLAPKSEVRMRFTSEKQVDEWRKQFNQNK